MSTSDIEKDTAEKTVDLAIIGAGPGGSAAAIEAAMAGLKVALIEREQFPRFHIGESLTGEVARIVTEWGLAPEMNAAGHTLKHGTRVYGSGENSFYIPVVGIVDGERTDKVSWQVNRSKFDEMLLNKAVAEGVEIIRGSAAEVLTDDDGAVCGVTVLSDDGVLALRSRHLVDASGMARFMQRQGFTGEVSRGNYARQIAYFVHLRGVDRGEGTEEETTRIYYAGLNHWSWLIPVGPDVTSLGIVSSTEYFKSCGETPGDFVRREMKELHPELAHRLRDAELEFEPKASHNYSYEVADYTGPGWTAIGDAHRFIDPIFSLGVNAAVVEGVEAARTCAKALADDLSPQQAWERHGRKFESWADDGQQLIQDLLDGFWGNPIGFGYLAHRKHHDDIVDIFSGRIYGLTEVSPGLAALRRLAQSVTL